MTLHKPTIPPDRALQYHQDSTDSIRESIRLAYKDLREWINRLDRSGELVVIKEPVSPYLEMAELADRAAKLKGDAKHGPGGPALLFENITGHPGARTLMNQFGSERRMKLALDVASLDDIAGRIRTLLHPPTPQGLMDKLKLLPTLAEVGSFFPKVIDRSGAACKQVILRGDQVDLTKLPVLTTWPPRRRTLHYAPLRHHQRPQIRQAQRRHVSHAGLR